MAEWDFDKKFRKFKIIIVMICHILIIYIFNQLCLWVLNFCIYLLVLNFMHFQSIHLHLLPSSAYNQQRRSTIQSSFCHYSIVSNHIILCYKIINKLINRKKKSTSMGVCYSEQQQWKRYQDNYRKRRKNRKGKKQNSIIYQQHTMYQSSFNSGVVKSFQEEGHPLASIFSQSNIQIGSIVELNDNQQKILEKSLETINSDAQVHGQNEMFSLCNLKSKSFLHTHRIKLTAQPRENEVSCCPYNCNHIIQYDLWKLIKTETPNRFYIYHPFTQRFLNVKKDQVLCSQEKKQWQILSLGVRRNGGYLKISCQEGQLCMTSNRALLPNHRKMIICKQKHISHMWQLKFGEIYDMNDEQQQ